MLPIIAVAAVSAIAMKWAGTLQPATRTRLMNQLDQFSAAAGLMNRVMTTVDAFRVVVAWSDTWPRDPEGDIDPAVRLPPPPLTVPVPVGAGRPRTPGVGAPASGDLFNGHQAAKAAQFVEF